MTNEEKKLFVIKRGRSGVGLSLFTRVPFKKGDVVIEYKGVPMPTEEADKLSTRYLFDLENGITIDGAARSNTARYINHSCRPNCASDTRDNRVFIDAIRNIKAGEELSFDYGEEYFDEFIKPVGCKCEKCSPTKSPKKKKA